jgi:hypothetical protein
MGEIIRREFGKEERDFARKLARLLDLAEQQEAEILANPMKYWRLAADKIFRLQRQVLAAQEALRPRLLSYKMEPAQLAPHILETVVVPKDRWERQCEALRILEAINP